MKRAKLTESIIFDADAKTIIRDGTDIYVFKRDVYLYNLLYLFCENPGVVLSKNRIYLYVYGIEENEGDRRLISLVSRLRNIIPKDIIPWRGNGYIYLGEGFKEVEPQVSPKMNPKTKASTSDVDGFLSTPVKDLDSPENIKRIDDAKIWLSKDHIKKEYQFYFEDLTELFQKRRTSFYDSRHNLDEFFVTPSITRDSDVENIHIKLSDSDVKVSKIIEKSVDNCVIITGPVGSGKTTLMSYLLMELVNNHEAYRSFFPIPYPINEYDYTKDFCENISTWLFKCGIRLDDAEEIPFSHSCIYFIDNIDRLGPNETESFIESINGFVREVSKDSVFILFSRPYSDFEEYERFEVFRIESLDEEKAKTLSNKLLKRHPERIDEAEAVINSLPAFCKANPYVLSLLLRMIIEHRLPVSQGERIDSIINSLIDGPDKNKLNLVSDVSRDYFTKFIQGVCEHLALLSDDSISITALKKAIEFANTKRRPTKRFLKTITIDEFTFDMTRRTGLMFKRAGEYSFIDETVILWGGARSVLNQGSLYELFYKEYPGKLDKNPKVFNYIKQFDHDRVESDLFYGVLYDLFGSSCTNPYRIFIREFHDPLFYYVGKCPKVEFLNGANDVVKRGIIEEAGCSPDLGNILFPVFNNTDRVDYYLIDDKEAMRMGIPRIACREEINDEYFSNHPELKVVGSKYSLSFYDFRGDLNEQQTEQYNFLNNQSLPLYQEFMAVMNLYERLLNSP